MVHLCHDSHDINLFEAHGGLLVVTCDLRELSVFFSTSSIPALRDHLAAMEVQSVPDQLSLPSFSAGYVKSGDILAIPMGTLVVSKAINGDAAGVRTVAFPPGFTTQTQTQSCDLLRNFINLRLVIG